MKLLLKRILFVQICLVFLYLTVNTSFAQFGGGGEPARLRDLEPLLVQLIYVIWALGGIIFTLALMFIGFLYMTSAGDPQKKEALKKRATNWLFGLILFFAGYPLVLTAYNVLGIGQSNPDCYKSVSTPGFHFFFPDVCTDPLSSTAMIVGGGIKPNDPNKLTQDELKRILDSNLCLTPIEKILAPVNEYIYDSDKDRLIMYENVNNATALCYGTSLENRDSRNISTKDYKYEYSNGNIFEISGTFFIIHSKCTNDSIHTTGGQFVCCYKGNVMPSVDSKGNGTRSCIMFMGDENKQGDESKGWFNYDDAVKDKGSCDWNTLPDDETCNKYIQLTGVPPQ